jgi:hypothetical protein
VTLTGNATWIAGSDKETGTFTLKALGTDNSRLDLSLTGGSRSELRSGFARVHAGQWIDEKGTTHEFSFDNCLTDAVWFFPALTSLTAGPNIVFSYAGQESWGRASVYHLRSYVYGSSALAQRASAMDFYLDSNSLLPVSIIFNVHPDDDGSFDIPFQISFSNYQRIGGVAIPGHIQRYLNRQLVLDLSVTAATFNSGLTSSTFATN